MYHLKVLGNLFELHITHPNRGVGGMCKMFGAGCRPNWQWTIRNMKLLSLSRNAYFEN